MFERADAIVIGAGVIGSSVALELARTGRRVIVVDKGPAPGAGSTSSSSSVIRFSYSTRDAVLTAWEAAALWDDWAGHLGCVDPDGMVCFIRTGNLIFHTPGFSTERIEALWDEVGIGYERLDAPALHERYPDLDIGQYFPPKRVDDPHFADDAHLEMTAVLEFESGFIDDPMLAAHNLAHAAKQLGAEFRHHQVVVGIEQTDGHVSGVRLADGSLIHSPVVVNVGGPHSGLINRMAGVVDGMNVRHRPLRQEVFTAEAPNGLRLEDGFPVVADLDLGQYVKPQPGGTWLVGGTEPECDEMHWVDDPDDFDEYPTVEQFEVAMLRAARRAPHFGVPLRPVGLAALYDATDDWVPIYDKSDLPGFFMACGTSGNQFKNAPLVGKFLAAIIEAEAHGRDHDLEPVQFVGRRTGHTIDLGAFSRRREKALTSGTVMG
jgi:glycine/D-amino acid oxidase-like deaminating enzyme